MLDNMANVMQIMDRLKDSDNDDFDPTNNELAKYFVDDYNHSAINGIKACLPYMDFKYQKNLTIFLKLIEMQRIIDMYKEKSKVAPMPKRNQHTSVLKALKPYLKDDKANIIDSMLKIMTMKEMMESMQNKEA